MKNIALFLLVASAMAFGQYSLPSDRQIPWSAGSDQWNGGTLPVFTSVTCTGLVGDGVTNDAAALQTCINNANSGTAPYNTCVGQCAVFVPAGTYLINSKVRLKSTVVLRGAKAMGGPPYLPTADAAATTFKFGASGNFDTQNFSFSSHLNPATSFNTNTPGFVLTGSPQKGDTTVTISTGSPNINDWIAIFGNDDPTFVNATGSSGKCQWCGDNTGFHVLQQIVQITNKVGSVLTLSRPLYFTPYTPTNQPGDVTGAQYRIMTFPTQRAGFENLRVDGSGGDVGSNPLITFQGCLQCWTKGVETYDSGSSSNADHVRFMETMANEMRNSCAHDGRSSASGANYGVHPYFVNSDLKIENNIFFHNRHSIAFEGGGSGSAVLSNYINNQYTDDLTYLGSSRANHGAHPYMVLFEGNAISHLTADDIWGTSSHNVFFRNWLWGDETGTGVPSYPPSSGFAAIDVYGLNTSYSFVGNVLGRTGLNTVWSAATLRGNAPFASPSTPIVYSYGAASGSIPSPNTTSLNHGNVDYKTSGVAYWEGGSNHTLSNSLYYGSKPAFFGTCLWPTYGPEGSPLLNTLPAIVLDTATVCPIGPGGVSLAGLASVGGSAVLGGVGTQVVLLSIQVSPPNPKIPFNQSQTFTAQGFFTIGDPQDITQLAVWTSSNNSVASPQGSPPGNNIYQCNARGTVTVTSTFQGVAGTTTLNCQSPTFTPQGTITTTQSGSSVTITQFVGANGTSPYTFSGSGLPGWLSLSNTGCPGAQINCSLVGTPSIVGVYNFSIQATDNLGNTACNAPGCAVSLNVVATSAEANEYCDATNHVIGLAMDGPANPLLYCYNTAIANTPTTAGSIIHVCPQAQVGIAQCALTTIGANPNADVCYTTGGVWCPSLQSALNYVWNGAGVPRCWDMQIHPTIDDTNPNSAVNDWTTPTLVAPGDINCGPQFSRNYLWIRTSQFANLPPLGNRVTPSWVKQASIVGRPQYSQTSSFGIPSGYYLARIRGESTGTACSAISSRNGALLKGIRFTGIFWTCPHSRDTSVDQWGGHVCPSDFNGSYNCSPGLTGFGIVNMGCDIIALTDCGSDGGAYNIFDRNLFSGCDDITMATCFDASEKLIDQSGADYTAVIDSYLIYAVCMYAIGPCVESHALAGGNPPGTKDDRVFKIVNNYVEASGTNTMSGGANATSGFFPTDREVRKNHWYKALTWKPDDPAFPGKVQDGWINAQNGTAGGQVTRTGTAVAWVSGNKFNAGMAGGAIAINGVSFTVATFNSPNSLTLTVGVGTDTNVAFVFPFSEAYGVGTTCSVDAPIAGTPATCTVTIDHGLLKDVTLVTKGNGYGVSTKANGNTYGAYPGFYLTDAGTTYASCQRQLSGNVDVLGSTVTWTKGNKFLAGLVGTQIWLGDPKNGPGVCPGTSCYTVASFTNNTSLIITGSPGTQTGWEYDSFLPSRHDCIKPIIGFMNSKNLSETKHVVRGLFEGNVYENSWNGASDQDGFCFLLSPKNANNGAPTSKVTDIVWRYNLCRNTAKGMQIGASPATQGGTISQGIQRASIHDNIFDGLNGVYWTVGTSPIQSSGQTCFAIGNGNPPPYQLADIKINHNTCIQTAPAGYSFSAAGCLNLNYGNAYIKFGTTPAMWPGMVFENSICAGGAKNSSGQAGGALVCVNESCKNHVAGQQPTEVALRQVWLSDFDTPTSGSNYTGNQVSGLLITNAGACTVAPTTCTFSGGGGTGASCGLTTSGASPNIIIKSIFPKNSGQNYTSAPTLTLNGTCPTPPAINVYIAGNGELKTKSGCYDHNGHITAGFGGEIAMIGTGYPTAQLDPVNNTCDSTTGGGNLTVANWSNVAFVNLPLDANGAECNGINCAVGDLHLQAGSPFHNQANDGRDMGADVDKVLGTVSGTPSQYTGCFISANHYQCPQ